MTEEMSRAKASEVFTVPENYQRRLVNYLRWATMDSVGTAGSIRGLSSGENAEGLTPEEVMYRWETKGHKNLPCMDASRLYRYAAGKSLRDFYVSNWVQDVRNEMMVAEEFICTGGMDNEEFHAVFKRYPDPWLLRRLWTAVSRLPVKPKDEPVEQRTEYDGILRQREFMKRIQASEEAESGGVEQIDPPKVWIKCGTRCGKDDCLDCWPMNRVNLGHNDTIDYPNEPKEAAPEAAGPCQHVWLSRWSALHVMVCNICGEELKPEPAIEAAFATVLDEIGRECIVTRDTHRLLTETSEDFADRMRRTLIAERRKRLPEPAIEGEFEEWFARKFPIYNAGRYIANSGQVKAVETYEITKCAWNAARVR